LKIQYFLKNVGFLAFLSVIAFGALRFVPADRLNKGLLSSGFSKTSKDTKQCQEDIRYGIDFNDYDVEENSIKKNEVLGSILDKNGVNSTIYHNLLSQFKHLFNVKAMRVGDRYKILKSDPCGPAKYFIYEQGVAKAVIMNLGDCPSVEVHEKEAQSTIEMASVKVETTLWDAMIKSEMSTELAGKMGEVLRYAVDFHHINQGDEFKLIYERKSIDGKEIGVGKLLAAYFKNEDKENFAFYFENKNQKGYFDQEGKGTRRAFLRSPLQNFTISSPFNLRRLHPILGHVKAHLGTDYAAPYGTPIISVSDGVVEQAAYGTGNGKFVKIRHDNKYETQYLHMSRFAKGIRPGTRINQGQVIGYVGSTGLATGPHVCFRFWKNGVQVNHLKENLPLSQPLKKEDWKEFRGVKDIYLAKFRGEDVSTEELQAAAISNVKNDRFSKP